MQGAPKTIFITGTSTGIGHAAVMRFADRSWHVFAGSRHPEKLSFAHPRVTPVQIDVTDTGSIAAAFSTIDTHAGTLDAVVNNAGYGLLLPFEDTSTQNIEAIFRANVFGLMEVSRHAIRRMRDQGRGVIVNVSSILGTVGTPFYAAYCATKWAVEGFSEALLHEVAGFGVRVKIVEPSGTKTEFHKQAYATENVSITEAYRAFYEHKKTSRFKAMQSYESPETIAALIEQAVLDPSLRLRYGVREVQRIAWLQRLLGRDGAWKVWHKRYGPRR
jgi:NAD(P)-dependent dehydrogenase (short-subunit alcohol dehydrogenase family)